MTGKNDNWWKEEAREHGNLKAANIDKLKPDAKMKIFMMEREGSL